FASVADTVRMVATPVRFGELELYVLYKMYATAELRACCRRAWPSTSGSRRKLPCGMNDVEHDHGVIRRFHEGNVGQSTNDEFACARDPSTFPDPVREDVQGFDFGNDARLDGRGGQWACFSVVIGENLLEVVQRLVGPQDIHARRFRAAKRSRSRAMASSW